MKTATHSCGKSWVQRGNATSHCAGCHRTFTSTQGFDTHRIDTADGRFCTDPAARTKRDGSPMFLRAIDPSGAEVWAYTAGRVLAALPLAEAA